MATGAKTWMVVLADVTGENAVEVVWSAHGTETGAQRMVASLTKAWHRLGRDSADRWRFVVRHSPGGEVVPRFANRGDALAGADCFVVDRNRFDTTMWLQATPAKAAWSDRAASGHHLDVYLTHTSDDPDRSRPLDVEVAPPGRSHQPYELRRSDGGRSLLRRVAIDVLQLIGTGPGCHIPSRLIDAAVELFPADADAGDAWTVRYDALVAAVLADPVTLDVRPDDSPPPPDSPPSPAGARSYPATVAPRTEPGVQFVPDRGESTAPHVPDVSAATLTAPHRPPDSGRAGPLVALLDDTLDARLAADFADSVAANTWKAYRADLTDFGYWCTTESLDWRSPDTVAGYLHRLEDGGAAYATIERRKTAVAKLVEALALAGRIDPADDPTRHPKVTVALKAIRRRLGTDQDRATPLTGERLIQVLLSIDTTTRAGRRDIALLLVGWYGALRRSELAGIRRDHVTIDDHGVAVALPRSKGAQDHTVWVPIARQPGSRWNPVGFLEDWLDELDRSEQTTDGAGVWMHITRGDTYGRTARPIGDAAVNAIVTKRVLAAGIADAEGYSAHSLRSGFVTEAKNRGIDEADIMRHTRHKSLQMMRLYDRTAGWWHRNPTDAMSL